MNHFFGHVFCFVCSNFFFETRITKITIESSYDTIVSAVSS